MHQHDQTNGPGNPGAWYRSRWGLALVGFASLSVLLLVYEYRLSFPFGNLLVFLPLLACIGLHSRMHGGHGGHSGHGDRSRDAAGPATGKPADDSEAGRLATTGPYARIRHPQYVGFVLILTGFLVQWPTILTLAMYPVPIWMYLRLARSEETEARARFGPEYENWARQVPASLPGRRIAGGAAS